MRNCVFCPLYLSIMFIVNRKSHYGLGSTSEVKKKYVRVPKWPRSNNRRIAWADIVCVRGCGCACACIYVREFLCARVKKEREEISVCVIFPMSVYFSYLFLFFIGEGGGGLLRLPHSRSLALTFNHDNECCSSLKIMNFHCLLSIALNAHYSFNFLHYYMCSRWAIVRWIIGQIRGKCSYFRPKMYTLLSK